MSTIKFIRSPMPIFAEYRPLYKLTQILLVLYINSRGGKSSLIRLQLFNWALKDEKRIQIMIESARERSLVVSVWGMDPSMNSAIQFGLAEGMIKKKNNGISITEYGNIYVGTLIKGDEFKEMYSLLIDIGKGITESMVAEASDLWG